MTRWVALAGLAACSEGSGPVPGSDADADKDADADSDSDADSDTGSDGCVTVDGSARFAELQPALDAARPGSTVTVCEGRWLGPFVAPAPVHLVGTGGSARTTLDGGGA